MIDERRVHAGELYARHVARDAILRRGVENSGLRFISYSRVLVTGRVARRCGIGSSRQDIAERISLRRSLRKETKEPMGQVWFPNPGLWVVDLAVHEVGDADKIARSQGGCDASLPYQAGG